MFDPATGKLMAVNKPRQNLQHAADSSDALMFDPETGKLMAVKEPQQNQRHAADSGDSRV